MVGPKSLQIEGVTGPNGDLVAFSDKKMGQLLKVFLRAAQGRWVALYDLKNVQCPTLSTYRPPLAHAVRYNA